MANKKVVVAFSGGLDIIHSNEVDPGWLGCLCSMR